MSRSQIPRHRKDGPSVDMTAKRTVEMALTVTRGRDITFGRPTNLSSNPASGLIPTATTSATSSLYFPQYNVKA